MKTGRTRIFFLLQAMLIFCFPVSQAVASDRLVITHDLQYQYARSLFASHDYDIALVEYKRLIHFFPDSPYVAEAEFDAARCLFALEKYRQAAEAFNDIIRKNETGKFAARSVLYQARAFMATGNTAYAGITLQNYLKITQDTDEKDEIYSMLSKIAAGAAAKGDFSALDTAAEYVGRISESGRKRVDIADIEKKIHAARQTKLKSPTLAGMLALIPGGGFAYCERYKDALITFLLNAGLITAAWQAWDNDNQSLAGVIGFVETGFYTANIYGSVSSAHKYNLNKIQDKLNFRWTIQPSIDQDIKGIGVSLRMGF